MSDSTQGPTRSQLRRVPKQERSRGRIDEILKVSMDLIGQKGIDGVTMKEIAALSGGPIASVYQYFPNKSAIVATLYERHAEEFAGLVAESVQAIASPKDSFDATDRLTDLFFEKVRTNPPLLDLINAIQADKALADVDIAHSRNCARMFFDATRSFVSESLHDEYDRFIFLMCHLTLGAIRLAILLDEREATRVLSDFKTMSKRQLGQFINGAGQAR